MLDPTAFATNWSNKWIAAWNARDLPTVLSMFANDVRFSSPKAPSNPIEGIAALEAYWSQALAKIPTLHFELIETQATANQIYVHYHATLNETAYRALELLTLREDGLVQEAHAFYGATLNPKEQTK